MAIKLDENPKNVFDRILKKVMRVRRDILRASIRREILKLPPAPAVNLTLCNYRIHMLVCKRDVEMAICSCKSLVAASFTPQPFIFHDDGSLSARDVSLLLTHFPGSKVILYRDSTEVALKRFGKDSLTYHYRQKGVMMLKLLDVGLFAETEKVVILDSDIIFFQNPKEIFSNVDDVQGKNVFNRDIDSSFMVDLPILEKICMSPLLARLNAGLSVINVNTIDFTKIEKWLKYFHGTQFIIHRIEQSILAMLSGTSIYKAGYLPPSYDVSYFKDVSTSVCKHYVGRIRHGFELEGLSYLIKNDFVNKWNKFQNMPLGWDIDTKRFDIL